METKVGVGHLTKSATKGASKMIGSVNAHVDRDQLGLGEVDMEPS
jgi:hypothetical protein